MREEASASALDIAYNLASLPTLATVPSRKLLVKKLAGVFPQRDGGVSENFRCGTRDKETPTRVGE